MVLKQVVRTDDTLHHGWRWWEQAVRAMIAVRIEWPSIAKEPDIYRFNEELHQSPPFWAMKRATAARQE